MGTFYIRVSKQRVSIVRGSRRVALMPGTDVVPWSADDAPATVRRLIHKIIFVAQYRWEAGVQEDFA